MNTPITQTLLLLIAIPCYAQNTAPVVSNVSSQQRPSPSELVDVFYDVQDSENDTMKIDLAISNDGGSTWDVPVVTVFGDVGEGVVSGTDRHIVWDAGIDYPGASLPAMRARVIADDQRFPVLGLVAYFPLDGNANDASGNGHHGNPSGGPDFSVPDRFGNPQSACHFDQVDDYIVVTDVDGLGFTTAAMFSIWINTDSDINYAVDSDGPHVFSKGATYGALWADYALGLRSSESFFEMSPVNNANNRYTIPYLETNSWLHLCFVYDSPNLKVYKNGTVIADLNVLGQFRASSQPLYMAHRYDTTLRGRYKGLLDDFRLYNRALQVDEVLELYHEGGWALE